MSNNAIFVTISGSAYEIDKISQKIRRLNGQLNPTQRQGNDGEWKSFKSTSDIVVGNSVLIVWPDSVPLLPGSSGGVPTTLTSPVKEIVIQ